MLEEEVEGEVGAWEGERQTARHKAPIGDPKTHQQLPHLPTSARAHSLPKETPPPLPASPASSLNRPAPGPAAPQIPGEPRARSASLHAFPRYHLPTQVSETLSFTRDWRSKLLASFCMQFIIFFPVLLQNTEKERKGSKKQQPKKKYIDLSLPDTDLEKKKKSYTPIFFQSLSLPPFF